MPRIQTFETWACEKRRDQSTDYRAQGHRFSEVARIVVVKITDEDGFEGIATCMAEHSIRVTKGYLHDMIGPIVIGRDIYDREAIYKELWRMDRHLMFFPVTVLGAVDVALWDIAAKRAKMPLYRYLGGSRTSLPVYYSAQFMDKIDDYVAEVKRARSMGFNAYKIHSKENLEIFTAVREAAGPDMKLMVDSVTDWTFEQALRVGRHLEKLNYYWMEEPFRDWNLERYAKLCSALDIPIAGTEVSAGGLWGVAQAIHFGAVDIVRADVAYGKMGVTETLKVAHLAEAFGMNCEIHCTLMGPMDIANLHVSCAINNCEFFELHMPEKVFQFPMKEPYPIDDKGMIHVPQTPGLGFEIDWDSVDNSTLEKLTARA
jgi:L-alanine-DL-glutamate epimerase-like enolase superfamily enzyme